MGDPRPSLLLALAFLTASVPAGTSVQPSLPDVENAIRVADVETDRGGTPRTFAAVGRTTVYTQSPVPVPTPTRVGNVAVLERESLGAEAELPLREETSIGQAPIKVSTVRQGDVRFVANGYGATPGGNAYDQGLSLARDGYFWGNLEQPDPRPVPFGVSCGRACGPLVQEGEYRERAFLASSFNYQYPDQEPQDPVGTVELERYSIDTRIHGRESDPSSDRALRQRMDVRYEVIDIAAEGGDVVAQDSRTWGPFRLKPPNYDGALSSIFYMRGVSDTGLSFTYEPVENDEGQIHGYDFWVKLEEGGRLPETTRDEQNVTWGAQLVAAAATFEWPNTTEAAPSVASSRGPAGTVAVPSFELPEGKTLPVHAVSAIRGDQTSWTVDTGPLPVHLTFAGPELRVSGNVEEEAVRPGPQPAEPIPPAFEGPWNRGQGETLPAPGHEGTRIAGEAAGLKNLSLDGLQVGDVGLGHLVVNQDPQAVSVENHTRHGGWTETLLRPTTTHLNAHWPLFVAGHFVDLHVFVVNHRTEDADTLDASVYLYADPVYALDSGHDSTQLVWLADVDLGGPSGDKLYRETFSPASLARGVVNFATWLVTGEEPYPNESGFMRVQEPRETVIRQQDQNEWPVVNDTVDGVGRDVLGVIASPITDRLHPEGERSAFYGVRHEGTPSPDPLAATLDRDRLSEGDLALYATTAQRDPEGPRLGHQVYLGIS